ncbi:YqaE/Pmp3 family membrane protein [Sphingomonas sp. KR3-1]|uniref:YqaE/Pmp3 family membrane protein n=1 Tax=Sphingomonas sp. KR3-1 TaxID=3156611 RepID=UPI0032B350A9
MAAPPGPVIAAVLLPPLGVYLARGPGRDFWIACGLTVLGFLPGAAFALWSVLRDSRGTPHEPAAA